MNLVKTSLETNLNIFQDKNMYTHSVDTILLGNFVSLNSHVKNILDIGANNGALSIIVAQRQKHIHIDAIEIQEKAIKIAKMNVKMNHLQDKISLICNDFNIYVSMLTSENIRKYDLIMSNPPFLKATDSSLKNKSDEIAIATHEIKISLEQIIEGSSRIINNRGHLAIIHQNKKLHDIVKLMKKYGFDLKRTQTVKHFNDRIEEPLVLIEGKYEVCDTS